MCSIKYSELFSILRTHDKNLKDYRTLLKYILLKKEFNFSENAEIYLTEPLRNFSIRLYQGWCKSNRTYKIFMEQNESWLQTPFYFPKESLSATSAFIKLCEPSTSINLKQR